jgi:hypothetical protein
MKVIKSVAHLMYNTCRGLHRIAKYQYVCNLQSRTRTHTVLVIGLYELLGPLLLLIYQCIAKEKNKNEREYGSQW